MNFLFFLLTWGVGCNGFSPLVPGTIQPGLRTQICGVGGVCFPLQVAAGCCASILRAQAEAFGASKSGQENDALSAGSVRGGRSWQVLAQRVFQNDDRPIILYDGICNLCNGGVNFMLDWDSPNEERGNFRFAALQSDVGRALLQRGGKEPDDCSSIVLALEDGNTYHKGEAVLRIGQGLGRGTALDPAAPILSSIAKAVVPVFLRDGLYDYIAKNRYVWFGESNECRLWDDRFDERFVGDLEP
mmetsp:Transcript_24175/g.38948  ORF Transcript_24175/g.38948 Transcript_24175/m.38948 type:complete len:244 (+) Transcript_24175:200-931(+)